MPSKHVLFALTAALALPSCAHPLARAGEAAGARHPASHSPAPHLPADVRAFIDDRDGCDHFRGEPVPEPQDDPQGVRRKQIEDALSRLCTGSDARLSALRGKYRDDPEVTAALSGYEDTIEAP